MDWADTEVESDKVLGINPNIFKNIKYSQGSLAALCEEKDKE